MHVFLKVSTAVLGSTVVAMTLAAAPARAATLVQSVSAADTFSVGPGAFPFSFDVSASVFEKFDTSLGTLNSVSATGSLVYDISGACSDLVGCAVGIDAAASVPDLNFSDSFTGGVTVPTGSVAQSDTLTGSIGVAPPLPLSFFEGVAGEPLFAIDPAGSVSGTLGLAPGLSGDVAFAFELDLIYDFEPVPEPVTTAGLLIAGGMGVMARRRKSTISDDDRS